MFMKLSLLDQLLNKKKRRQYLQTPTDHPFYSDHPKKLQSPKMNAPIATNVLYRFDKEYYRNLSCKDCGSSNVRVFGQHHARCSECGYFGVKSSFQYTTMNKSRFEGTIHGVVVDVRCDHCGHDGMLLYHEKDLTKKQHFYVLECLACGDLLDYQPLSETMSKTDQHEDKKSKPLGCLYC